MSDNANQTNSGEPAYEPSRPSERPRLSVDLRDPSLTAKLKAQASASNQKLKGFVNDALERFLEQPTVFSDQLVENLDLIFAVLQALPMDRIEQLAAESHRSLDQMIILLVAKGIAVYEDMDKTDPD
ncbi:MAG: hypothetical protein AAF329_03630 [Cyanobacteria bacterium P01_A01_bin.17]